MSAGAPVWKVIAVWVARVLAGAVFAVSGWAKAVDPRGFVYKIDEYLTVWGLDELIPSDIVLIGAVALSLFEMTTGILLLTGCLRRSSALSGLALMAFMLPLTLYIAIANPVADCGCFGDLFIVSNTVTFVKNLVITGLLLVCLLWYKAAQPLYRPGIQWLVVALTCIYGIIVSAIGWQFQPMVDFRPYGVGKTLVGESEEGEYVYLYSKDGEDREFTLDNLPDSTWTFVERHSKGAEADALAVFDGDYDITAELFDPSQQGDMLVLAVSEPGIDNLIRTRLANELYGYAQAQGIQMLGIVALSGENLERWMEMAMPDYDVYSASDTSLKQLVRGPIGLVYLHNGHVAWKRNFTTINPDFLEQADPLGSIHIVDDGRVARWLTGFYVAGLLLLLAISALTKINLRPKRKKKPSEVL